MPAEQYSVFEDLLKNWFRPYQLNFLRDKSTRIIVNKSRRIGFSDALAFKMVLVAADCDSGIVANDFTVISKDKDSALEVIDYVKKWVEILSLDPEFGHLFELSRETTTMVKFKATGFKIRALAQSPKAGRSASGHVVFDEAAFFQYYVDIEKGAGQVPNSDPRFCLWRISTPNGSSGQGEYFYNIWHDTEKYHRYSRHQVDLYQAVEQGMPVDPDQIRRECQTEADFQQEFLCQFIGGAHEYIGLDLLRRQRGTLPVGNHQLFLGLDVASQVDTTSLVPIRKFGSSRWIDGAYMIDSLPYETGPESLGQDLVVDALIRYLTPVPEKLVSDSTGEGSKLSVFLASRIPKGITLQPHVVNRKWKNGWVPEIRGSLERGTLWFSETPTYVFNHRAALEYFAHVRFDRDFTIQDPESFVEACFTPAYTNVLFDDFRKVRKVQTETGITFQTRRDATGHGDSFWGSLFSLFGSYELKQDAGTVKKKLRTNRKKSTKYQDYLNG